VKLTPRDERLIRDIALSHVLSRDQVIRLGYFTSVTRLNTRLRELRSGGLVSVLDTPFFDQHLYVAGKNAPRVVGEHIASLLSHRAATPRFLQHALAVTESRTALLEGGGTGWRFEAQLRHSFLWSGRTWEIRPDGLVRRDGLMTLLEVDMGHVDPGKFGKKLKGYEAFIESGELARVWGEHRLAILTLTTGALRRTRLARRVPSDTPVCFSFLTFDDLRIRVAGGWS
jgi:hypothetical protein